MLYYTYTKTSSTFWGSCLRVHVFLIRQNPIKCKGEQNLSILHMSYPHAKKDNTYDFLVLYYIMALYSISKLYAHFSPTLIET